MLLKIGMSETQEIIIELPDGKGQGSLYSTWKGLAVSGKDLRSAGGRIEGQIDGSRIRLLPALEEDWERELFGAEKEKVAREVATSTGPEMLPEEGSLVIRRDSAQPYWIEIETELAEWQERLSVHPQALLQSEQRLGDVVSRTFLLPASLLVIEP